MIDYFTGQIALDSTLSALSTENFADPAVSNEQQLATEAFSQNRGAALIGVFVRQVLSHAVSDGQELAILDRATDLWNRGVAMCAELGAIRLNLEGALADPTAPGATDRFNEAVVAVQEFAHRANSMRLEIDDVRAALLNFPHLRSHPRQRDLPTDAWQWDDLTTARRTDAFIRNLYRHATTDATRAFALGAVCGYGAAVSASGYIGHTVGGPRRTHRHRHRIARNSVGSWLAVHHPAATPLSTILGHVTLGALPTPVLPGELVDLVLNALRDTFDLARTPPLPDLQLGYTRLLQHMKLLDGFGMPEVPQLPAAVFVTALLADPRVTPLSLRPQDADVDARDGGGVAVTVGNNPSQGSGSPSNSNSAKVASGCGILVLVVLLIDVIQAFVQCCGQWANGHTCTFWQNMLLSKLWEQDPPDPRDPTQPQNPSLTAAQLSVLASTEEAGQLVALLFDIHSQLWEAMAKARAFLAVTGLIYPADLMTLPAYAQFAAIPASTQWPRREEADPTAMYVFYPSSPVENPATTPSPHPAGATPDIVVSRQAPLNAVTLSLDLWQQIAARNHDSQNRDLDADRGTGHYCWAARGSILDDPVDVVTLGYTEQ